MTGGGLEDLQTVMAMGMALSSIAFSCALIAHALHHDHNAGYTPAEWNSGETILTYILLLPHYLTVSVTKL